MRRPGAAAAEANIGSRFEEDIIRGIMLLPFVGACWTVSCCSIVVIRQPARTNTRGNKLAHLSNQLTL